MENLIPSVPHPLPAKHKLVKTPNYIAEAVSFLILRKKQSLLFAGEVVTTPRLLARAVCIGDLQEEQIAQRALFCGF